MTKKTSERTYFQIPCVTQPQKQLQQHGNNIKICNCHKEVNQFIEKAKSWVDLFISVRGKRKGFAKARITPFSKIQLLVYYQCCVLIGCATTRLCVIAQVKSASF